MDSLDAAEQVLAAAGVPLQNGEITRRILDQGLWHSDGKTPVATISAALSTDVKHHADITRFERCGPGIYGLRIWTATPQPTATSEPQPATTGEPKAALPPPEPVEKLSFADAAEVVLERFAHKKPMHYRAITQKILELGLVQTKGQTPEATLYAQVMTETKRRIRRGDSPRFTMQAGGQISLAKWLTDGDLAYQIEQHNDEVRKRLHARLRTIPPADFEALIGQLLVALGFEDVERTPYSGDDGIDVRGTLVVGDVIRTRMAVQVKRWKKNVQSQIVQQVRGSLGTHEQGLIITTSDFSQGAREEAARADAVPVGLMNGQQLVALLVENDIGVKRASYDLVELVDEAQESTQG
jgi:restriction system protein